MAVDIRKSKLRAVDELQPHPRNYRDHPEDQLRELTESIRTHGFYRNVVVSSDGYILAGHGVVQAARELGMAKVPVVEIPVEHSHPAALQVLTGDNALPGMSKDDADRLRDVLLELSSEGMLGGTGYTQRQVDALAAVANGGDLDPDHTPIALPDATVSLPGDLWVLGEHRLLCGDSTERDSYEFLLDDDVADIVDRCNSLAEIAGSWLEEQTLSRVCDAHGSNTDAAAAPYVLRPDGAGTALYSATADTPGDQAPNGTRLTNNALVDEEDLESAREVLASMKDSRGKRVAMPMSRCVLLVPDALVGVASKIIRSEYVPGVENEVSNWGPRGLYQPRLISSPRLDDISTSAWYLGDFKKQFVRKWKLRMEYVTLSGDTQKFLDTRVAFQARLAWDVEVGARDYVYVVQSLSGTTYTPTVYV